MRYLGLDLGSKTLGIAISEGVIASIYETYRFKENDYFLAVNRVIEIVKKEQIGRIVLGYPKHMNNDIGIRGKISEDFKAEIEKYINVDIILQDERMTSMIVNKVMISASVSRAKRKKKKDELAAVIILQNHLDGKKEE